MNKKIRNMEQLLSDGDISSRKMVLTLMEEVLRELDAGNRIKEILRLEGDILHVGQLRIDLKEKDNIYLIGAGKACNAMAQAVCEVLGERLTKGIISVKIAEPEDRYTKTEVFVSGHPLPDESSVAAAEATLKLVDSAGEGDLFISVISGGSSALYSAPIQGITPAEEREATRLLLESGAKIEEINAVRRHISLVNGGNLAKRILARGAQLVNLIISDGVGNGGEIHRDLPVGFFGTPIAPDKTTLKDARDAITNYNLKSVMAESIVKYLWSEKAEETPKLLNGNVTNFLLDRVPESCIAAIKAAGRMGVNAYILTTFIEGESKEAGMVFSSIAREAYAHDYVFQTPCFILASGETTTCIEGEPSGTGGPSQEMVLGFAMGIQDFPGICMASIDSEGTDGTTVFAGGIVDSQTVKRLEEQGISVHEALRNHSSCEALKSIGDNIFTGNTGTNVCDFDVAYIPDGRK